MSDTTGPTEAAVASAVDAVKAEANRELEALKAQSAAMLAMTTNVAKTPGKRKVEFSSDSSSVSRTHCLMSDLENVFLGCVPKMIAFR